MLKLSKEFTTGLRKMLKDFICHFITGHSEGYEELHDRDSICMHHGRDYCVKILADASTNGMTEKEIRHMLDDLEKLRMSDKYYRREMKIN